MAKKVQIGTVSNTVTDLNTVYTEFKDSPVNREVGLNGLNGAFKYALTGGYTVVNTVIDGKNVKYPAYIAGRIGQSGVKEATLSFNSLKTTFVVKGETKVFNVVENLESFIRGGYELSALAIAQKLEQYQDVNNTVLVLEKSAEIVGNKGTQFDNEDRPRALFSLRPATTDEEAVLLSSGLVVSATNPMPPTGGGAI